MDDKAQKANSNEPQKTILRYGFHASWRSVTIPVSSDPRALPFGPSFCLNEGEQVPPIELYSDPKEVLHIPVKRTKGDEIRPALQIHIALVEDDIKYRKEVVVRGHEGAKVIIKVFNLWGDVTWGQTHPTPVVIESKLSADGTCDLEIPAEQVRKWLDPKGPLGGRINENLLDFTFECPSLVPKTEHGVGGPIRGQSSNRIFLYRKKLILFLPGVFGSQVRVLTPDGRELGFPNFFPEPDEFQKFVSEQSGIGELGLRIGNFVSGANLELGALECDKAGQPLLRPLKPTLLSIRVELLSMKLPVIGGPKVYDVFNKCHQASFEYFTCKSKFRGPSITLVHLKVLAYDWRCDLTESAVTLAKQVAEIHSQAKDSLQLRTDFDDEVALAGHSTGGVIIRRALKEPGMKAMVSHAFYLNVPFLGAPKALGVILTGQDPPGGDRMVDLVQPESLSALSLGMPIVYHLAPTANFPGRVAITPHRPFSESPSIELDKSDLVNAAIDCGFLLPASYVSPIGLSASTRGILAARADAWYKLTREAHERSRAREVYKHVFPGLDRKYDDWHTEQLALRRLEDQFAARSKGKWNVELANRARVFHAEAESVARDSHWEDKAFIFYSVAEKPTTLRVHFEREREDDFAHVTGLLEAEGIPLHAFAEGDVLVPRGSGVQWLTEKVEEQANVEPEPQKIEKNRNVPTVIAHQWSVVKSPYKSTLYRRTVWKTFAVNKVSGGDSTVPTESLLGYGGKATFIKAIPSNDDNYYLHPKKEKAPPGPEHVEAPSNIYVWKRIVEVLQGTLDREIHEHKISPSHIDNAKTAPR
jgi:hypothetical protein